MVTAIHYRVRPRGFTLVEAVIALVVLAAAAAGVLLVFSGPMAASADPMVRAQARAIASSYLDEIMLRAYGDGSCDAAAREDYGNIWCYDGLDEPPTNQFGDPIGALAAYNVVTAVSGDNATAAITVKVTHDSGRVDFSIESRRANY